MKKIILCFIFILILITGIIYLFFQRNSDLEKDDKMDVPNEKFDISVIIDETVFEASLFDNDTTRELVKLFPMTVTMNDLNENEKYYYLPKTLPMKEEKVNSIKIGDIMLYQNNCLVLFYKNFSTSYSNTQLGNIEFNDLLLSALSKNSVEVTFKSV